MKITVEYAKEVTEKIDSTLLRPDALSVEIEKLCKDAVANGFKSVCVNPINVPACKAALKDTPVKVCTVIGFPLGEDFTKVKVYEARRALRAGAEELDVVMCISAAKMGRWDYVGKEIKKLTRLAGSSIVKIIIETCFLSKEEIKRACEVAVKNGARFIKTSTGYGSAGAKLEDVAFMHNIVTELIKTFKADTVRCEIKASGGIKTYAQAKAFVEAGATRIGTSAALEIVAQGAAESPAPAPKAFIPGPEPVAAETVEKAYPGTAAEPAQKLYEAPDDGYNAGDIEETDENGEEPVFAALDDEEEAK